MPRLLATLAAGAATRAAAAMSAAALIAACTAAVPPPTPPSAEALRDRAVATLRDLSSVHFTVSHEAGGTDLGGGLTLLTAEGDALFPDRAELSALTVVESAGINLSLGIVQIARDTYVRDPVSRIWREAEPGTLPFNFVGMHDSLADALAATTGLALTDGGERDGVATFLLSGTVAARAFAGLVPGALEGSVLRIDAWIGREDALPRSIRLAGALLAGDPPEMVRLMALRDFNAPVTVEPPL
ncbi:MAG: LppX_LprAFG lipoprotein [Chloroflexi bacterium]|nr:LppX_LprAFG lipoprotein [Chloroflexota bacterium]